ncbi:hypothetical protein Dxin01_01111 [Deinococcus xinjiangensis]|uniref:Uncharacterized protein n=1 Tax=Deinococcus xinjiangensis TaxID=457454 RepID=A0ABP9V7Y2_9DEIO
MVLTLSLQGEGLAVGKGWGGDGENFIAITMPCLHFLLTTSHFPLSLLRFDG